jgi:hypothetical protein
MATATLHPKTTPPKKYTAGKARAGLNFCKLSLPLLLHCFSALTTASCNKIYFFKFEN